MKKRFFSIILCVLLILSNISITGAAVTNSPDLTTLLEWEDQSDYKEILKGDSASFEWYVISNYGELQTSIRLVDAQGNTLKNYPVTDNGQSQGGIGEVTPNDYLNAGTYTIELEATGLDQNGDVREGRNSITLNVIDTNNQIENISVSANPQTGTAPLMTLLVCSATGGDGTLSYSWNFGDGTSQGRGSVLYHTYTTAGTYTATCTAEDEDGDSKSGSVTIIASAIIPENIPPEARFTISENPAKIDEWITFTSTSTDSDGYIAAYEWSIDGVSVSNNEQFKFAFGEKGTHYITLTVTDNKGAKDSTTKNIYIEEEQKIAPEASFTISSNPAKVGEYVTFTSTSTDQDGNIVEYEWSMSGTKVSNNEQFGFTFTQENTYVVTLTVRDNDGLSDSTSQVIVIEENTPENIPPTASFTISENPAKIDEWVTFTSTSTDSDGYIAAYEWSIDGVSVSNNEQFKFAFGQTGTHYITLTVTDNKGAKDSTTQTIVIQEDIPEDNKFTNISISANPQRGTAPLFTQLSCEALGGDEPINYQWYFGDGSTTNNQNPAHSYTTAGTYTATCIAKDTDGDSISDSITIIVEEEIIKEAPQAAFIWNPHSPKKGENTVFTSTSSDNDGYITSYSWNFGDGTTSSSQNPTHSYTSAGIYYITLRVIDNDGLSDVMQHSIIVEEETPLTTLLKWNDRSKTKYINTGENANFEWYVVSYYGGLQTSVQLKNLQGTILKNYPVNNGGTSDGSVETVSIQNYLNEGVYYVELNTRDTNNRVGRESITLHVIDENEDIEKVIVSANPNKGTEPLYTQLTCEAIGGDKPINYQWYFGDGSTSNTQNPTHSYTTAGTYTATCIAKDKDGDRKSGSVVIVVEQKIPEDHEFTDIIVNANPNKGTEPLYTQLTCLAIGGDEPINYQWYFGDGSTSNTQNPSHSYTTARQYTATCVAKDKDGDSISESLTISVEEETHNIPPIAQFVWNPQTPIENEEVQIVSTSTDEDGYIVSYEWDTDNNGIYDKSGSNIKHTYTQAGIYVVTLRVRDNDGASDSIQHTIIVEEETPEDHEFTNIFVNANPNKGTEPLYTQLNCEAIGGDEPINYQWYFGDGSTTNNQNPSHTYSEAGTYTATCIAKDTDGDSISGSTTIIVEEETIKEAPQAAFVWNPQSPFENQEISFTSTSTDSDGYITSYSWNFGDGTTSSSQNPTHSYTKEGIYYVTLSVTDNDGLNDNVQHAIIVKEVSPITTLLEWNDGSKTKYINTGENANFEWYIVSYYGGLQTSVQLKNLQGTILKNYPVNNGGTSDGSVETVRVSDYVKEGTYYVELNTRDTNNRVGRESITLHVIDENEEFTDIIVNANPQRGTEPLYTQLNCEALGGDEPINYQWYFGDGSTSNTQNPSHSYTTAGTYTATCIAKDTDGDSISGSTTIIVEEETIKETPTAEFVWNPQSPNENEEIQIASTSFDKDGYIVNYEWDINNDGRTDYTGETIRHTYTQAGIYLVTLRVTDNDGLNDNVQHAIIVEEETPEDKEFTGIIVNANPQTGTETLFTQLTCLALGGNEPINYQWYFGDGSTSNTQNPTHSYTTVGTYTATCVAEDSDGDIISESITLIVEEEDQPINQPPEAEFVWYPSNPIENQEIQIVSTSTDEDGYIVSYEWDTDNNGIYDKSGSSIRHTYTQAGVYIVTLRVRDNEGLSDSVQHAIIVQEETPEDKDFTGIIVNANPQTGTAPLFTQLSCEALGGDEPISYQWYFGDGSTTNNQNPSHSYTTAGTYTATCIAEDADGETISGTTTITVEDIPSNKEPEAEFVWYPNSPFEDEEAQFVSTSTDDDGYIVSYEWNFGDGNTAYTQNPEHTYTKAGLYLVSLRVRDNDGLHDVVQHTIIVKEKIVDDKEFTNIFVHAVPNQGTEPLYVKLSCEALGGNNPINYYWNLGDGSTSYTQNPSHTYSEAGTYTATCIAEDEDGDSISDSVIIVVKEEAEKIAPTAEFVWNPQTPNENKEVEFISTSTDEDGYIINYEWDMGDGNKKYGADIRHTYTNDGIYLVKLRVTDNDGLSDSVEHTIIVEEETIEDKEFTNIFVNANPRYGEEALQVSLSCLALGGDEPINYFWNLGDGSTTNNQNPTHSYTTAGTYTATCIAKDKDGDSISDSVSIVVEKEAEKIAPQAEYVWNPERPVEDEETQFVSTSTDEDGYIINYEWDMGDGNKKYGADIRHTYTNDGIYLVTLRVTDNDGLNDVVQHTIIVDKGPLPEDHEFIEIFVNANPTQGVENILTQLTCTAIGGDAPVTYFWNLGDGSTTNNQNPTHSYTTVGTYTATCIAKDNDGDMISGSVNIRVEEAPEKIAPKAEFVWNPQNPFENEEVQFVSTSTDEDGYIINYEWDMGDGNKKYGLDVQHTYTNDGIYLVTLRVTDNDGLNDIVQHSIIVEEYVPEDKEFTNIFVNANPTSGTEPLFTHLTCTALGGDEPISYFWNLGDGSTTNTQNPSHTYSEAGTYTATCIAKDKDGDVISGSVNITVEENIEENIPPVALFEYTPVEPEEDEEITFDASNSYDPDGYIVNYEWDFDNDGTWDLAGRVVDYTFAQAPGGYLTLRVTDNKGARDSTTQFILVKEKIPEYDISAECNPNVVQGKREYCVAQIRNQEGEPVSYERVWFTYTQPTEYEGESLGSCVTNFKGDCHISPIITKPVGNYLVEASNAEAGTAQTGFKVWAERYDVVGLEVYEDDEYTQVEDTFYRGEDMYVSFGVYDMIENEMVCDESLVQEVFLKVNNLNALDFIRDYPTPASKAAMESRLSSTTGGLVSCSYEYKHNYIPLSDDFLGDGRVFAFTFNFNDDSAGQSSKAVNILNNPVELNLLEEFLIEKQYVIDSESVVIDLKNYVSDVETANSDILYEFGMNDEGINNELIIEKISHGVYKITAPSGVIGTGRIIAQADDTDGSIVLDDAIIQVTADSYDRLPVAIIDAGTKTYTDTAMLFDGSKSYDPDGTIVRYDWNFGDGTSSNDGNAIESHTFTSTGTYVISLEVTDNSGNTDSTSIEVFVTSKTRLPACSDGKDNDADGLIDMDDPGCTYPSKDDEGNIASSGPEQGLKIRNIEVISDTRGYNRATAGDVVVAEITIENFAGQYLDNIRAGFSIPELGIRQKSGQFSLDEGDRKTKNILVYIPYDAAPGEYYTEITAADGDIRRSTHGSIRIE